jgi:ferredoxin-like protein FixX
MLIPNLGYPMDLRLSTRMMRNRWVVHSTYMEVLICHEERWTTFQQFQPVKNSPACCMSAVQDSLATISSKAVECRSCLEATKTQFIFIMNGEFFSDIHKLKSTIARNVRVWARKNVEET